MNTQTIQYPCAVSDEILLQFTKQDHPVLKNILTPWNYRGDGTESGNQRLRFAMSEQEYEHYHWDTVVSNGCVMLCIRKFKHSAGIEPPMEFGYPAQWHWCFSQIEKSEDVEPLKESKIRKVPVEVRKQLEVIPGLEWMSIIRVNYWSHNGLGPAKRKSQRPPSGLKFFKFTGGFGCAASIP